MLSPLISPAFQKQLSRPKGLLKQPLNLVCGRRNGAKPGCLSQLGFTPIGLLGVTKGVVRVISGMWSLEEKHLQFSGQTRIGKLEAEAVELELREYKTRQFMSGVRHLRIFKL